MVSESEKRNIILKIQQSEITEAKAFRVMSDYIKQEDNRKAMLAIADELEHEAVELQQRTGTTPPAWEGRVKRYTFLARVFGFTFASKLMYRRKLKYVQMAQKLAKSDPEFARAQQKGLERDQQLFDQLDEKRLSYVGAMILGMNDAIVEITGTLAGLTLAMQDTRIIALSGLITGIAATLSMAASEYLAERSNGKRRDKIRVRNRVFLLSYHDHLAYPLPGA